MSNHPARPGAHDPEESHDSDATLESSHRPPMGGQQKKPSPKGSLFPQVDLAAEHARRIAQRPGRDPTEPHRRYSSSEVAEIKRRIEYLYTQGTTKTKIRDRLRTGQPEFRVSLGYVERVLNEVRERWAKEAGEDRPHLKNAQIRRLYRHLALAQEAKDFAAIAKFESQLMDLQGTREPIKVDHQHTQNKALMLVFANADDRTMIEELQEALREQALIQSVKAKQLTEGAVDAEIVP